MPITKKYSVDDLLEALEYYYRKTRRRPTFEYIPFDGYNDTYEDIKRFVKLSKRIPCKVNIIRIIQLPSLAWLVSAPH